MVGDFAIRSVQNVFPKKAFMGWSGISMLSGMTTEIAAEVKGFQAKAYMDFKAAKRMELFSQYAVAAAKEAFADAGLDMDRENAYRAGVIVGSGIGSLQAIETNYTKIVEKGPRDVYKRQI